MKIFLLFKTITPLVFGVSLLLGGCVTPLSQGDIENLTHCNISIKKAKKNLIIAGYAITSADEETLVTDFKQVSNSGSFAANSIRILRRISVVKINKTKVKIIPRFKTIETRALLINSSHHGQVGESKNVNESEAGYYKENIKAHQEIKREVCG